MPDQKKAYAYGLATVLLWSTVATAFKLALQSMQPAQLLLYSGLVSTLALALLLLARGGLRAAFCCSRKEWLRSLLLGALNPFLYYLILFRAYDLLPAQEAQPLNYTWAITLTLLSIPLLGQRISAFDLLAVLVSYSGVVIISTHGDPLSMQFSNSTGVTLALLSTVIWSLYWIYNTKETREPVAALFLNFLLGLPLVAVWCACFEGFIVADPFAGLIAATYVGLFEMGITFVLWLSALKHSENAAKVGNLIFLSPFLSLVFIHFFLGEVILTATYAGLGLIIAGLLLQRLGSKRA